VWTQVSAVLHDPSLVAAEVQRRQAEGPDPAALAERDRLQRRLHTCERQQQRLIHHFREDESAPWELVRRELAQIEQDKRQIEAALVAIDQRLAEQQMVVTRLEALETYCAQVSRQCERFDFDGKRLALEALDIQVTANGREWHLDGRIPVDDAGVVTQTSGGWVPPPSSVCLRLVSGFDRRRHDTQDVDEGAEGADLWARTPQCP
jgi:hypothetical protein